MDDFPVFAVLFTLAGLHAHQCGYPVGGSLALAQDIEQRYRNLGGQVHYRARVEKVLIEDGRAVGLRLADGSEHRADRIVSAADGHWTIFDLLEGHYVTSAIQESYRHAPIYPPMVLVSVGVRRDLSDQPHAVYYPLTRPFTLGGKTEHWLGIRHYGFDAHMAPAGKAVIAIEFFSDYEYWCEVAKDPKHYAEEKQRIRDWIVGELEARFAGITEQIDVIDIATPVTFTRYTGVWKGAFMGWKMAVGLPRTAKSKTLPGLSHFYMAGQWVEPTGGLPSVVKSGRDLVQLTSARARRSLNAELTDSPAVAPHLPALVDQWVALNAEIAI